jgi:ABC-type polysaccharide/polyol phosphate transport system ATPase subunit
MSAFALSVRGLGKQYHLRGPRPRYRTLRDVIAKTVASPFSGATRGRDGRAAGRPPALSDELVWALREVSFDVARGEVLGVIGRNGAGKSTLLKVLSRITDPTTGRVEIHGRVGSLLEVGTGFHPELTGRENVYLNGAFLGMHRGEITRKFDEIVAFAETERFIDTPVKHYSSGMYLRLAFAVAAHLEAEVMLVDEVLAVGDAAFQRKCMGKMGDVAHSGRTVLFVSHNLDAVQRLCQRSLLMADGRLLADERTSVVVSRYLTDISAGSRANHRIDLSAVRRLGSGRAAFRWAQYASDSARVAYQPYTGGPLEVSLAVHSDARRAVASLAVTIYNQLGSKLVKADTRALERIVALQTGMNYLTLRIDRLYLNPGVYRLGLSLADPIGKRYAAGAYDLIETAFEIEVLGLEAERISVKSEAPVACEFTLLPSPVSGASPEAAAGS